MTICKHVFYSGQVQGVGFRYSVQSLAAGYAVTGFVRNLPRGDVELVAEGQTEHVAAFLDAVCKRMASNIARVTMQDEAPSGHQEFNIRF